MKIIIEDQEKKKKFIEIFRQLGKQANDINIYISNERFYIQGMDGAQVALFEVSLHSDWFDSFDWLLID